MPAVQLLPPDPKGLPAGTAPDAAVSSGPAQAGESTGNSSFNNILSCAVNPPVSTAPASRSKCPDPGPTVPPADASPVGADTPATVTDSAPAAENPSPSPPQSSDRPTDPFNRTPANGVALKIETRTNLAASAGAGTAAPQENSRTSPAEC